MTDIGEEIQQLADYISAAREMSPPPEVRERAVLHTLDTLAAVVSGYTLPAGRLALGWLAGFGEAPGPCTVPGRGTTSPFSAALSNGMAAHADETDDSHFDSHSHPGCAVVPAAMAAAEHMDASAEDVLRAVIVGYDVGCRVGRAVSIPRDMANAHRSSHSLVGEFGAMAAAAVLFRLNSDQVRHALSYTAQLNSGVTTWMRDTEHVEKAFVFAGMPASQGILAVSLVASGCSGVDDVFTGNPNWFDAVSSAHDRSCLIKGLGSEFELLGGTLKKYSVGSPAQAAVEAVVEMMRDEGLAPGGVDRIEIHLPSDSGVIVDRRLMPAINVQYLVAGTLLDGGFSFEMAHDAPRMASPVVQDLMTRTDLVLDDSIRGTREATVVVERTLDGATRRYERHVGDVEGTSRRPMTPEQVRGKALDLVRAAMEPSAAEEFCDAILGMGGDTKVRSLMRPLQAAG